MFTSITDLFKLGIGPSSSHTNGPMIAAKDFVTKIKAINPTFLKGKRLNLRCRLTGSLAYTGIGHGTDTAILLGLNGYSPVQAAKLSFNGNLEKAIDSFQQKNFIEIVQGVCVNFGPASGIDFDMKLVYPEHPNGFSFTLSSAGEKERVILSETYFSVGGGFILTKDELADKSKRQKEKKGRRKVPFGHSQKHTYSNMSELLSIAEKEDKSFAVIQMENECMSCAESVTEANICTVKEAMFASIERGLSADGKLPGGLLLERRANKLYSDLSANPSNASVNDWLCAYAMAVNEENAAGQAVVTAPTNGAAGVVPALLYYLTKHEGLSKSKSREFLLTATVIGAIIKDTGSISGAEVGCQGEIGSASAMAAAACCAVMGGTIWQIENAAEIALEHHLGMTCDPVKGLVQVPCIERNGFGAIKAYAAASLAMHGNGSHLITLDNCIAAMKQTGEAMSEEFKETSQGGLAVRWVDC